MKPRLETTPTTLNGLLDATTARLASHSDTPELDSQVLLAHVLGKPRTLLLSHPEATLDSNQASQLAELIQRIENGEPLPYVLGHWEFFGLDFDLTPDVLIPRPETELLVERAISWLKALPKRRTVADVGTGSGCIAIALAVNIPDIRVTATDLSEPALKVARQNAQKYHVDHLIDYVQCDLLPPHPDSLPTESQFDLICANLPYIPTETLHHLPVYGREPTLALDGGRDGLDPFRKLIELATEWLAPNGKLLLEIEASHGLAAVAIAYDAYSNAEIHLHQDLSGRDRLLEIQVLEE